MTINVGLLRQTLAHIEDHPGEWCQLDFRSSSGLCFASRAVVLAGGRWLFRDPEHTYSDYLVPERGDNDLDVRSVFGADGIAVSARAARLLGLDVRQADTLFAPGNSLADLRQMVTELIAQGTA